MEQFRPRRYHHRMRPGSMGFHHRFYRPYYDYGRPYIYNTNPMYEDLYYYKQAPTHWVGKLLVRKGQQAPPNWSNADIIYENSIPERYAIVGPTQISGGYDNNRLLIYVNGSDIIENVRYG